MRDDEGRCGDIKIYRSSSGDCEGDKKGAVKNVGWMIMVLNVVMMVRSKERHRMNQFGLKTTINAVVVR